MSIGLIGGSGIYNQGLTTDHKEITLDTPYGFPSSPYISTNVSDKNVFFLSRHGLRHNIPPHKVNYKANIWGFKELGVKKIISINAVGAIDTTLKPGDIVLLDQIIDMTFGARSSTFFDGPEVAHIDFTNPFCDEIRRIIQISSIDEHIDLIDTGTYVCVNGPRLETAAEIRFFSKIGASVVGMTLMPEASLIREAEMCFSSLAVVTNMAAGITKNRLTTTEVIDTMKISNDKINKLLKRIISLCDVSTECACNKSLEGAFL
ncbi:MAG: S-methyl-5'-thioadenosine phosphorylase [Thermodesulfovibrionales bacterium]|nr:S-methyl-5'-thioadenosine phosphorylase [Thermodesulfovibrionales bacterium]